MKGNVTTEKNTTVSTSTVIGKFNAEMIKTGRK